MNGWLTIKTRMLTGPVKTGLKDIMKSFGESAKSVGAMVKSFAKMALILGSIIGIYKLISGGIKALVERNEELASKIENIKLASSNLINAIFNAMANLLEPVITKIIDLVYTFLSYLNVITKAWFGIDLFAKKTEKSTAKTSKNLASSAKSAKQIEKSLAGFDEVIMLSDSSTSGSGGGTGGGIGGGTGANIKIPKIEIPSWVKWIANNKETVKKILSVIASAIGVIIGYKIGSKIGGLIKSIGSTKGGLIGALIALDAILITKIVKTIKDDLIPLIKETEERIESTIEMTKGRKNAVDKMTDTLIENAKSENENTKQTKLGIDTMLESIKNNNKENEALMDQIDLKGELTGENKMNIETMKQNRYQNEKYIDTLMELYDMGKLETDQLGSYRQALGSEKEALIEANKHLGKNTEAYKQNKIQIDKIDSALNNLPKGKTTTLKVDTADARKSLIDYLKDVKAAGVESVIGLTGKIDNALNKLKVAKLAKGGIVSNPGSGVYMGNYIAGERGAEAVIPLTDDTLQRLASMIPITIDLTNTIDGRVLNKRLETIRANDNFARNGVR